MESLIADILFLFTKWKSAKSVIDFFIFFGEQVIACYEILELW